MSNHNNTGKPKIVVTGFGPFGDYSVNASWEAVKNINKDEIEKKYNCELITLQVPVAYISVDQIIPELWTTYQPKLMIHTGVSYLANCLNVETQAFKYDYELTDFLSYCPEKNTCPANGDSSIGTKLNVERICGTINEQSPYDNISAVQSNDPGRFLCGYIYYTSLSIDNSRTLFVHVPETQVYASERTARGLEKIIDLCMNQIN